MAGKCGECTMCCKLLGIPELNKPKDKWCQHCDIGKGCRIYDDPAKPEPCNGFACIWLQHEDTPNPLPANLRPDKCKVMMYEPEDGEDGMVIAMCDPHAPNAWVENKALNAILDRISKHVRVVVGNSRSYWVIRSGVAREALMGEPDERGVMPFLGFKELT